jgi:hypothetical protein
MAYGNWPPVLVRRSDNKIVDGHYRYLAARELGHDVIECRYFDGGDQETFLEALRLNCSHGLPLSLREREMAASRLMGFHPEWSDRRIAKLCSVAPGTVWRVREAAGLADHVDPSASRVGRDGKRRPVDPQASRARIVSLLNEKPNGSIREIARLTGSSPATVRSVKIKLALETGGCNTDGARVRDTFASISPLTTIDLQTLGRAPVAHLSSNWLDDSALQSTDEGRGFVDWFEKTCIDEQWRRFVEGIPISRVYELSDEARRRAAEWLDFASMLEERVKPRRRSLSM